MSDLKNSTGLITSIGERFGNAVDSADQGFASALEFAVESGFTPDMIADGDGKAAFERGVMIGWQNEAFTVEYFKFNGDQPIAGTKWHKGRKVKSVKTKRQWQTQFRKKVGIAIGYVYAWYDVDTGTGTGTDGNASSDKATLLESMTARVKKDHDTLSDVINGTSKHAFWKNFEGDVGPARKALADALKALESLK